MDVFIVHANGKADGELLPSSPLVPNRLRHTASIVEISRQTRPSYFPQPKRSTQQHQHWYTQSDITRPPNTPLSEIQEYERASEDSKHGCCYGLPSRSCFQQHFLAYVLNKINLPLNLPKCCSLSLSFSLLRCRGEASSLEDWIKASKISLVLLFGPLLHVHVHILKVCIHDGLKPYDAECLYNMLITGLFHPSPFPSPIHALLVLLKGIEAKKLICIQWLA